MKRHDKIKASLIKLIHSYKAEPVLTDDNFYIMVSRRGRLRHLLSYCKIKDKERHKLIDMINSSDEENYTVAESIILNKLGYAEASNISQ